MEHTLPVWGAGYIFLVGGFALIADSRRHAKPDDSLSLSGWIGIMLIALCLISFFFAAAWDFGRVVWIIPMLAAWALIGWAMLTQTWWRIP